MGPLWTKTLELFLSQVDLTYVQDFDLEPDVSNGAAAIAVWPQSLVQSLLMK